MEELLIPPVFQHNLISGKPLPQITHLRPWQKELLRRKEWKEKMSCICVSPTSGGKTLIAEIAIAQALDENIYGKAIYATPYISLACEKFKDFSERFDYLDVLPFYHNVGRRDFKGGSIGVCTYERAHSLINQAITGEYASSISLIVIDEIHMVGDMSRGSVCESLIMKAMALPSRPRIVGLTATLSELDANRLAQSINGFSHISASRNASLKIYIFMTSGDLYSIGSSKSPEGSLRKLQTIKPDKKDKDGLIPLVRPIVCSGRSQSIVVFVGRREDARSIALFLAKNLNVPSNELIEKERSRITSILKQSPAGADNDLIECVESGVAFHHAGLLLEERAAVESGIRNLSIPVVVATTTLSAGVNIRSVSRVIILHPYRRGEGGRRELMTPSEFAQMSGRAGRTDTAGEVVIVCRSNSELSEIVSLIQKPIPDVEAKLDDEGALSFVLQSTALRLPSPSSTPQCSQPDGPGLCALSAGEADKRRQRLTEMGLLHEREATPLGKAVTAANLGVSEGIALNDRIASLLSSVCLADELHVLSLCVPPNHGIKIPSFRDNIWESIFLKHASAIERITKRPRSDFDRLVVGAYQGLPPPSDMPEFERAFCGSILLALIDEQPLASIAREFSADRGSIQALQNSASAFAGQAGRFADTLGMSVLAVTLARFRKRINFGVREELLDLMSVPAINRRSARALYDGGIENAASLAEAPLGKVSAILEAAGEEEAAKRAKSAIDGAKKYIEHVSVLMEFEDDVMRKMASADLLL